MLFLQFIIDRKIIVAMNRRHILHVKNTLSYAGDAIVEYNFACLLKDKFVFDWFLISDEVGVFENRFKDLGSIIVHSSQLSNIYNTRTHLSTFYEYLKHNHYDTVYIDTCFSGRSIWLLLAKLAGVPRRILHSHNSFTEGGINPIIHWIFKQIMYISVTDYVACSPEAAKWLFPKTKLKQTIIIKNGIDISLFKFNESHRERVRHFWNIPDSAIVLGHVGRFCEMKNHKKIISIFNEFHSMYPESYLLLIGDGPLKSEIEDSVSSLNLSPFVKFIGNINDVFAYYSAMDFFIFPSLFEGLGIAAIEAECSGLFVFISDCVPKSAILTDWTKQIELRKSDREWAEVVFSNIDNKHDRFEAVKQIKAGGYDIKDAVLELQNLLLYNSH